MLVSIPLLALGLPPLAAQAATQSDPIAYAYDEAGRLRAVIDPSAGAAVYSYDAVGNLVSIARQNATATSIIEVDPDSAPVGSSVTIYGTGFSSTPSQNTVTFNGAAATVTSASATTLVATVPVGASTGPINVTSPAGSATSSSAFTVVAAVGPSISGFSPTTGTPGTSVAISGNNFDPRIANDVVTFNGIRADVTAGSSSSLTANVPSVTSGKIAVYTPSGKAVSAGDFLVPPAGYTPADIGFSARMSVGGSQVATIGAAGQIGIVLFDGAEGQRVSLNLRPVTVSNPAYSPAQNQCCSMKVSILSPIGTSLVAPTFVGTNGGFIDTSTLPQDGTYTILLDPEGTGTGSATLSLYNVPADPNPVLPTNGSPTTITISTPGQNARPTFTGIAGHKISLNVKPVTIADTYSSGAANACCSANVYILKPDGTTLTSKNLGTDGGFLDVATLPSDGTYTILVDPLRDGTGSATLKLYDVPADPNPVLPTNGSPTTITISTPGQNARPTFTGIAGHRVSLNVKPVTIADTYSSGAANACCTTNVYILKPNGDTLTSKNLGTDGGFLDVATLPSDGTYTILVDPLRDGTGSATLKLYDVPADPNPVLATNGSPTTITISTPGQNARPTLLGAGGQTLSLTFSNVTVANSYQDGLHNGCCSMDVWVLKPDGTSLIHTFAGTNGGSLSTSLPVAGTNTYTVLVDPSGDGTGSFSLAATLTGGGAAPASGTLVSPEEPTASAGGAQSAGPGATDGQTDVVSSAKAPLPGDVVAFHPPGPEEWVPTPADIRGVWRANRPSSPWTTLTPLATTMPGTTGLAGQVLTLKGEPLEGVTLEVEDVSTVTDDSGRFVLEELEAGHAELEIDGTTANRPGREYGTFEFGVDLNKGELNLLPFTVWMPLIDTAHEQSFASPTTKDMTLTTPRIPGLEIVIPAGSVVKDSDGNVVTELSITPIPIDRTPFPLPSFFEPPVYFTVQPGGSYVFPDGAQIIYPNYLHQPPGARAEFWDYDPEDKGWYVYGYGTVSADGKQVVPDPGVRVYEFSGAMINDGNTPPPNGPKCSFWATLFSGCHGGDPVDPQSGLFTSETTDLYLPGPIPISLTRVYRQGDTNARAFGLATNFTYGMFLWSANQYQEADFVMPDGARVHYIRTSPGTGFMDAAFESTSTPGPFYKSTIVWNGDGWDLTLKDGTVYVFGENRPLQRIRDRYGNQITITRTNGQSGNITQISATGGRWIKLSYDASNRIIQARDNVGRTVGYHYDANGRLDQVTDVNGSLTKYTWGTCTGAIIPPSCNQIASITDPRDKVVLTNEYDTNQRVKTQTLADGTSKYQFVYTLTNGSVTKTDITDPNGFIRSISFNADGWMSSETLAKGKTYAQTFTYNRQAGTGLLNNVIDPLSRKTSFTYDPKGNVKSITRLDGKPAALTTSFTYDPAFNQLASVTDPLTHSVNYSYNAKGNLESVVDALGRTSHFTYNNAGQLKTARDPLDHVWTYNYTLGDLTSVTDPLGRTTSHFVDSAGRVVTATDALGHVIRREYDERNQLTKVTDPLGGTTLFDYDPAGNLETLTDARQNVTTYGYDAMDRMISRQDALLNTESFDYDGNSNVVKFTDRKGQVTTYQYDGLNRRTFTGFGTTGSGGSAAYSSSITYTYDAGNRVKNIADTRGGTITRTYDDFNRLTNETAPNAPRGGIVYTYDKASRRATMKVGSLSTVTYAYNNANQPTAITQGTSSVGFDYDAAGRTNRLTLPDGIVQTYGYDDANELTSIAYTKSTTTLGDLAYGYDGAGRRTAVWGSYARTGLPPATSATASYNANNQLASWNGTNPTYDPNGNLTGLGSQTYTWNDRNQLSATSAGSASYAYDGLGRRLSKTVGGTTTKFLYDGANVVQEQNSSNTAAANLLTGLGIDQTFSRSVVGGATSSLLTDALGSTIALADANGSVQTFYTYDPFGTVTVSGATNTNSYQFTGRESDGSTGLYFYRARYYSSAFSRFISEDPLGFPGGPEPNLYSYVGNDPVSLSDPSGLDPGNNCGFLGFGCLSGIFSSFWNSMNVNVGAPFSGITIECGIITAIGGITSVVGVVGIFVGGPWLWIAGAVFTLISGVAAYKTGCLG
jgi:RHS repeat-associated protein